MAEKGGGKDTNGKTGKKKVAHVLVPCFGSGALAGERRRVSASMPSNTPERDTYTGVESTETPPMT